jgi:cobalt-zinc-cadmium efflux system outer membrane protein
MGFISRVTFVWLMPSLAVMAMLQSSPSCAQSPSAALTLQEALSRTLKTSPQLAVFPPQLREAEALQLQADLRPALELETSADNVLGSNDYRRGESAEYSVGLSQVIELGDKREQRLAVADIQRATIAQDYELARLDTLAETARRFIQTTRAQQLLALAERQLRNAQAVVAAARQRATAGAVANSDVSRMRIGALQAALARDRAIAELSSEKIKLAASWGAIKTDFLYTQADLHTFAALPSETQLEQRLQTTPRLLRLLSEQRLREAQLHLAESGAAPDLRFGAGLKRFAVSDDNAVVLSFSMPLFSAERNRATTQAARARYDKTLAERQLAEIETRALLGQLWQQLLTQRREAQRLHTEIVPAAAQVLVDIQQGYREGRYSALDLLNAANENRELEKAAIESAAATHLQLLELERLTGQPLTDAGRLANTQQDSPL